MKMAENSKKKKNVENARYEQFLLFPQCFQKTCTADMYKQGLVLETLNSLPNDKVLDRANLKAFCYG